MPFWTYMLHCNAGRFYTGHTDNLEHSISDHKAGRFEGFTKDWLPVELVWVQEFSTRDEAKAAEKQIKGWSRAKKLALIRGDWDEISRLAKKKGSPSESKTARSATGSGQAGIEVSHHAFEAMISHASRAAPHEACGLLLGFGQRIERAEPARNIHPAPATRFEIDPQALIDAHRAERAGGAMVLGYYHSHPVGAPCPSPIDTALAAGDGRIWAIVGRAQEYGCDEQGCDEWALRLWRAGQHGFDALSYCVAGG